MSYVQFDSMYAVKCFSVDKHSFICSNFDTVFYKLTEDGLDYESDGIAVTVFNYSLICGERNYHVTVVDHSGEFMHKISFMENGKVNSYSIVMKDKGDNKFPPNRDRYLKQVVYFLSSGNSVTSDGIMQNP